MNTITNCISCGSTLTGKQRKYCSDNCKNTTLQSYNCQKERALNRKLDLISRFGSKCQACGYNKNLSALSFHHLDPSIKEFKLDSRSLSNRTLERIEAEVKKCVLLCLNCHSELHNPKLNLESITF